MLLYKIIAHLGGLGFISIDCLLLRDGYCRLFNVIYSPKSMLNLLLKAKNVSDSVITKFSGRFAKKSLNRSIRRLIKSESRKSQKSLTKDNTFKNRNFILYSRPRGKAARGSCTNKSRSYFQISN